MIDIRDLWVTTQGKQILKGLNLSVEKGKVHAIMGPNGSGKSTLAKVLAGDPSYQVEKGEIWFKGQNILELDPEERAHLGLFVSFQYPVEIPGVSNFDFLFAAINAKQKAMKKNEYTKEEFSELLDKKMQEMKVPSAFCDRGLNEGFSGGEKKRNEILQMALLDPALSILDETDSGLDIDALRVVAEGIEAQKSEEKALVLITHYQRLLNYVRPDIVHVFLDGKIVRSGSADLALELEKKGYDWLIEQETVACP